MLKNYHILTITHRNTNLKKIRDFVIRTEGDQQAVKLESLKQAFGLEELMYVSTCNRVAYFFHTEEKVDVAFEQKFFQAINPELSIEAIEENVLSFGGMTAIDHLMKVAASIDSMVVGEREILRQLREAYAQSKSWGLIGDNLRIAFDKAVVAAKEVYAKTRIGEKQVSVVSLAIKKLLNTQLPKDARIVMIGAGQTNTLVTKFLAKHKYENLTVFNRTLSKAQDVASLVDGQAFPISEIENYKDGFDCLIVCTGATKAIVDSDLYSHLLNGEQGEKVVIDLAIPHNITKEVVTDFNINYIEIEGLKDLAKENISFRTQEVSKAEELLDENLRQFELTCQQRLIERAMKKVPTEIKAVKQHAMTEVFKKEVETLDENARKLLEEMMSYMEKKCISIPMKAAKEAVL